MWNKRKLTRKSLDEWAKIMPVLSEEEQRECIGGYGRVVRGTGTFSDPMIIQETFNVTAWSFGKDANAYSAAVASAVSSFNNQGVHMVGYKYYKLEFVCNIITNPDDYVKTHKSEDILIGGNNRFHTSNKPGTEGSSILEGAEPINGTSGIVAYYKTIEDTIGSGAIAEEAIKRAVIHEIGHTFGLDDKQFAMMNRFGSIPVTEEISITTMPGDIDSGAIIKMIENNPK